VPTAAAGIRLSLRTAQGEPVDEAQAELSPIPVQTHALFNPTLNYVFFLLAAILPSVLQIVMVTASAYSVGIDVETRHRLRILRRLGGGLWPAMAGKVLPYTIVFLMVLGLSDAVLFGILDLPLHGRGWLLDIAGLLFILSCQFLGVLLALLLKPTAKRRQHRHAADVAGLRLHGNWLPALGHERVRLWLWRHPAWYLVPVRSD